MFTPDWACETVPCRSQTLATMTKQSPPVWRAQTCQQMFWNGKHGKAWKG